MNVIMILQHQIMGIQSKAEMCVDAGHKGVPIFVCQLVSTGHPFVRRSTWKHIKLYVKKQIWLWLHRMRDVILCGCNKDGVPLCARPCVRLCARACMSVLILPVKMILQPSLISSSLSKQRKRRLVTPPPLLLSVSPFILSSTSVLLSVCLRVRMHAGVFAFVCGLSGFT